MGSKEISEKRLDDIAKATYYSGMHRMFLNHFVNAWMSAEVEDRKTLKPAFLTLIDKYDLDKGG